MPTAEGRVETERPGRYLTQLCHHIDSISARRTHGGPRITLVESSETAAIIDFEPWGRCGLRAAPNTLTLTLEAADEENLRRLQDMLTKNLTRFGRRDHLAVNWDTPHAGRRRRRVLLGAVLLKLVIVALILALPSGLAISLGAGHAAIVLVVLAAGGGAWLLSRHRIRR